MEGSKAADGIPSHEEIERMHAQIISLLLQRPHAEAVQIYYTKLAKTGRYDGIKVKEIGGTLGKGVFAERNFESDELVLKESLLVGAQHSHNKFDALVCSFCFQYIGSIEIQIGRRLYLTRLGSLENSEPVATISEDEPQKTKCEMKDECGCDDNPDTFLPESTIDSLLSGNLVLPHSDIFQLPPVVNCLGGCTDEFFCSQACAEAAWYSYHSILCTGSESLCKNKDALLKFKHHADETNDIFHVAAQVIAATVLKALNIKNQKCQDRVDHQLIYADGNNSAVLLEAWMPFAMGYKRLWWESVALPTDVQLKDEPAFREELRRLASDSLSLLKSAIFTENFAPLFSLQVYGHIIGMFELNNLDLVVASPVEDYFIYIDELPCSEKEVAERLTKPLLDALGDKYTTPCEGTAFFPMQSCINHSCSPNTKAFKRDEDRDGRAVLLACRPISKGEEITISYIDENASWEERKLMLDDYGFSCHCSKCTADADNV